MAQTTRIPRTIPEFYAYVLTSTAYLLAWAGGVQNYVRLGMSATDITEWNNRMLLLRDDIYLKYISANTKTKTVVHQLQNFMEDFFEFAQPLLNSMATNPNANENDEGALNFKIGRQEPVHPTAPIAETCFVTLTSKGQGAIQVRCKSETDTGRASVPADATGVELRYTIGDTAPSSVDQCTLLEFSSKANFTFNVGASNSTKKIFVYARWIDFSNKSRAGAFSEMSSVVIG
jgi:hypothetical protein